MNLYKITEQKLYYFKYSKNTIKTYLSVIYDFENNVCKHYSRLNSKDIQEYLDSYKFTSISQQNQVISALKFAWEKGLGKKYLKIDFKRPRKEKKLPKVIDAELLATKIKAISNLKHRTILTLGLSCGLRVSEVVNLKWSHLDRERNILNVVNGKGKKDRCTVLNDDTIKLFEIYWRKYKSKEYVFNGQFDIKYSTSSIQNIVKKYISPKASFHLLRHAYGTFAIDNGTPIKPLSVSMGHNSVKTTEIYHHLSTNTLKTIKQAI
ncbi:tyrosine-type recombinase/integrase [Tenacibaculum sp.]|uniref:tyrosine-type recombinase/integrase n=1 Tax=Tenacibaculum sp. TaxID=1906242 RepID=UPI003D096F80